IVLRPVAEERSRPSPVDHSRPVENRDRDLDRADISPTSPTSPVGSIDTSRVRSNHRASCSRSLTLKLSPFFASVPFEPTDHEPEDYEGDESAGHSHEQCGEGPQHQARGVEHAWSHAV